MGHGISDSVMIDVKGPQEVVPSARREETDVNYLPIFMGCAHSMDSKAPPLAELIREHQQAILVRWRQLVRQLDSARSLDVPTLNDHIPELIGDIADAFARFGLVANDASSADGSPGTPKLEASMPTQASQTAELHGKQRLRDGFDLAEVVAEYSLFRDVLIELLIQHNLAITIQRLHAINCVVDASIARAVQAYAGQRSAQLKHAHREHLRFLSHDLRSPLQAITLSVARLERQGRLGPGDEKMNRLAQSLQRNSTRLLKLVNDNLQAAEQDAVQVASPREIDLWVVVERLIEELGPLADVRQMSLVNEVDPDALFEFDPPMLDRMLQNLMCNAIAAGTDGRVTISAPPGRTGRRVVKVNNWPGQMSDEQATRLNAPLSQRAIDNGVTGRGLSIVRQFADANGSRIDVTQTAGDGVTITISPADADRIPPLPDCRA